MSKHVHDENCNHDHDNSIVLVDDSGEEMKFEIIITLEHEGKEYALLKKPEDDSDDMFAFRIEEDEDGELLIPVEEDKEIEMIQKIYNELSDEDED